MTSHAVFQYKGYVRPLRNDVLAINMERGEKMFGKIILTDDDGQDRGIRPRWCQVWRIGSEVDELSPGEWILVKHGRWSRGVEINDTRDGMTTFWKLDTDAILLRSPELPKNLRDTEFAKATRA